MAANTIIKLHTTIFLVCEAIGWMPLYLRAIQRLPGWMMFIPAACFWGAPLVWLLCWLLQRRHYRNKPRSRAGFLWLAGTGLLCAVHTVFLLWVVFE